MKRDGSEGDQARRMAPAELGELLVLDADELARQVPLGPVVVLAHVEAHGLHVDPLAVHLFKGDIKASDVSSLREEISAILTFASKNDEIFVTLESAGGTVHGYGLAASQLKRIRDKNIKLIVAVDKVAASGGYMMACVADKIIAAPFAIIGSIGVLAQIPNFYRLLKKHNVDFEQVTVGQYKRTLTLFGENTDEDREKVQEELEETHQLFKDFIKEYRDDVDIDKIATGEHWYGKQAIELKLVDELKTSDDYLSEAVQNADIYEIDYIRKKPLSEKIISFGAKLLDSITYR